MIKPKTVLSRWKTLCEKVKNDKTKRKAPGRKEAKKYAAKCGMKSMLEVEMATEMDRIGMKWEYEPHSFEYHLCPNWNVHEVPCGVRGQTYTPDFYLPKQGIYL